MYYKVITILLFCVMTFQVGAQKYKTVLPYRMVEGKMIVDLVYEWDFSFHSFLIREGVQR